MSSSPEGLSLGTDPLHLSDSSWNTPELPAATEHLVGSPVVVGDRLEGEIGLRGPADFVGGGFHHGEVAQAEEVHLQETDALDHHRHSRTAC